jgi:hypothetical protein
MDIVASRILSIPYCRSSRYRPGWPRQEQSKPRTKDRDLLAVSLWYRCGGSGIGGLFGHVFISDSVAESIGWPTGNPFQLEVGFANLAIGILGIIAMGRRDGFREATVIAVTGFLVGATIVHVVIPGGCGAGSCGSSSVQARDGADIGCAVWRGITEI